MSAKEISKELKIDSKKYTSWIKKAEWREANAAWLDLSFKIATKILGTLAENKKEGKSPKSQKELAQILECSNQYVSKLVKGKERLQIDTITKLEKVLDISLIQFVDDDYQLSEKFNPEPNKNYGRKAAIMSNFKTISFPYLDIPVILSHFYGLVCIHLKQYQVKTKEEKETANF